MRTVATLVATLFIGCALGAAIKPVAPAPAPPVQGMVTVQLSVGTAQELLLALSGALNPTAPIPIPDSPSCPQKK